MPTAPYASLATLKLALGITNDTSRDALLVTVLEAASRHIDRRTGRRFYLDSGTSARTYRTRGRVIRDRYALRIMVDDIATETGLVVALGFTAASTFSTVAVVEYLPENALARGVPITELLLPFGMWAHLPTGRVRVTATWGWPAVPDEISQACLLLASRLFKRKDSPDGVAGSAEWGVVRVASRDPDVEALIAPYVLPDIG